MALQNRGFPIVTRSGFIPPEYAESVLGDEMAQKLLAQLVQMVVADARDPKPDDPLRRAVDTGECVAREDLYRYPLVIEAFDL